LEARLNGGKFEMCKISKVSTSSAFIVTQASKMLALPCEGKTLHMARNIFYIHKVVLNVILSNVLVEAIKFTPFNGSFFLRAQSHF
jgi:hypothetical protein